LSGWIHRDGILTRGTAAKDRRTTALHEAAHAVVAHRLGAKVRRLWIVQRPVRNLRNTRGYTEIWYPKRQGRIDAFARTIICLAGHEAEHRVYGRPITALPLGDLHDLYALGMATDASLNLAGWTTRRYVRWHLPAIRRVARALLTHGDELSRRQFLAAVRPPKEA
jgi:hypothetical protein